MNTFIINNILLDVAVEIDELAGNQAPPPNSVYTKYFGKCGLANESLRSKRSILTRPHSSRRKIDEGEDYVK